MREPLLSQPSASSDMRSFVAFVRASRRSGLASICSGCESSCMGDCELYIAHSEGVIESSEKSIVERKD